MRTCETTLAPPEASEMWQTPTIQESISFTSEEEDETNTPNIMRESLSPPRSAWYRSPSDEVAPPNSQFLLDDNEKMTSYKPSTSIKCGEELRKDIGIPLRQVKLEEVEGAASMLKGMSLHETLMREESKASDKMKAKSTRKKRLGVRFGGGDDDENVGSSILVLTPVRAKKKDVDGKQKSTLTTRNVLK